MIPLANEEFIWPGLDETRGEHKVSAEQKEEEFKEDPDKKALLNPEGRAWIPNSKLLRKRICIIVHCGVNGNRGRTATLRAIEAFFYWVYLEKDVKQFCRTYLHSIGSLDSKVPRFLGEALHASRRNQVIHYDFLFVKNTRKFSFVLVLKDYLSHFVELVVSERTNHVVIVHALVDWYKRFGIAETRVCDKGSHFKNKVVAELNHILKTKHQFTTEYSPKSNGTVKKVNREIMQVLRSLVFEFKISWNSWSSLLPLKQSALNNYKSANLAGQAPITVFTCFPAYNPLAVVLQGTDAISSSNRK